MRQGRKSKTVLALCCALALVAISAIAPALASAEPGAIQEYQQGGLPSSGSGDPPQGPADGSGASVSSESSGGGGVPILLIVLAVIAAACTGVGVWRLRRPADDPPKGAGRGTGGTTTVTSETQSL
jgi:hypothetical protein